MDTATGAEKIEFRRVILPDEIEMLCEIDRRIFQAYPADLFSPYEWTQFESYWMIADDKIVGCSAFVRDADYDNSGRLGCLHIMSTGVLREFRRQGLGMKQKLWQIEFARREGFHVIVTNMRESNLPMLRLNLKLGFRICGVSPAFYPEPVEPAIVMELQL